MNQRIFYLVTGMAGAGKSTVLNALEDSGFYCVDNLPAALFDKFFELLAETSESRQKVALAVDMRSGAQFSRIIGSLKILDIHQIPFRLIFLNCEDHILVKRFKETRRRHPLYKGNLLEAIQKERRLLRDLLDNADMVLDTSALKTRNLHNKILAVVRDDQSDLQLHVAIKSFGFKHGTPDDCDLVIDVRFMENPFYMESLRSKRGTDPEIQNFLFKDKPEHLNALARIKEFISGMLPDYEHEGRRTLTVGIGCTGGHHRSVAVVERLYEELQLESETIYWTRHHRDTDK
ncbi:MAG: RNase adapter RapZ [bacterium]|nr:RNase adapter RapZ [bacterium]